jgi:F-type H+-transporting ATPase subunit delta
MAEPITIARPYARAAFESASAAGALAAWSQFLSRSAAWVHDAQIAPLIGDPRVRVDQLTGLLRELIRRGMPPAACVDDGAQVDLPAGKAAVSAAKLEEEQHNFLALLAQNGRLPLLSPIVTQYEELRAQAEHIAEVEVSSAQALSPEQSSALKRALERRLGRAVRLHESVDPALLGGATVRYGDFVVDGSLRRRVERLAASVTGV